MSDQMQEPDQTRRENEAEFVDPNVPLTNTPEADPPEGQNDTAASNAAGNTDQTTGEALPSSDQSAEDIFSNESDKTVQAALTEYFDEDTATEVISSLGYDDIGSKPLNELSDEQRRDLLDMIEAYE